MKISWIFAETYRLDPTIDIERIKSLGPSWGSWKTWRSCGTDNVICHDRGKAQDLLRRNFQTSCNLYIPKDCYSELGRPLEINLYEGDFKEKLDGLEDIIAMHLASANSDVMLLIGFDLSRPTSINDKYEQHKIQNRLGLIRSMITNDTARQWVVIDHSEPLDAAFQNLDNLTCDQMENVLKYNI